MDTQTITRKLSNLPLGDVRYFSQISSTNSEAARWAEAGAPDLSILVADEQTAGKGRHGRTWLTPAGAALAFSLVLRQEGRQSNQPLPSIQTIMRMTALGALAVCEALERDFGLQPQIKWPNDVLLDRRKTCGVLAEAFWQGEALTAVILGIGINIAAESVPSDAQLAYPATCVEIATARAIDRWDLLQRVLERLLDWRLRLDSRDFIKAWDDRLAFKGEWVHILNDNDPVYTTTSPGMVIGLDDQGRLMLKDPTGNPYTLLTGELRLRPIEAQPDGLS
jgi:BirA family biotin operon repressor/biotin-[acetyl-CoA-carboxylase] ligase